MTNSPSVEISSPSGDPEVQTSDSVTPSTADNTPLTIKNHVQEIIRSQLKEGGSEEARSRMRNEIERQLDMQIAKQVKDEIELHVRSVLQDVIDSPAADGKSTKNAAEQLLAASKQTSQESNEQPNDGMTIDGVSAIAAIVIASFAVDRFATLCMFALSLFPQIHRWMPDPKYVRHARHYSKPVPTIERSVDKTDEAADAEPAEEIPAGEVPEFVTAETAQLAAFKEGVGFKRYYIAYYIFAVAGAASLAVLGNLQILHIIGFKDANQSLEFPLTILLLTAGADRIQALFASAGIGGSEPADPKPLEVHGSLNLETPIEAK